MQEGDWGNLFLAISLLLSLVIMKGDWSIRRRTMEVDYLRQCWGITLFLIYLIFTFFTWMIPAVLNFKGNTSDSVDLLEIALFFATICFFIFLSFIIEFYTDRVWAVTLRNAIWIFLAVLQVPPSLAFIFSSIIILTTGGLTAVSAMFILIPTLLFVLPLIITAKIAYTGIVNKEERRFSEEIGKRKIENNLVIFIN